MSVDQIVFGATFIIALGASLAMLFARNAVHVALFLVAAQLALALAFLLQGAYFIAAIQVIVYAGAIMILFLFVIMLIGVDRPELLVEPLGAQRPIAIALGGLLATEIAYVAWRGMELVTTGRGERELQIINENPGNVKAIARMLFSDYLLPFEATSILLVVAIVGVMVLTRRMSSLSARPAEPIKEEAAA